MFQPKQVEIPAPNPLYRVPADPAVRPVSLSGYLMLPFVVGGVAGGTQRHQVSSVL